MSSSTQPGTVDPWELIPSHKSTKSSRELEILERRIRDHGFVDIPGNPVSYVVLDGAKYIVDGHHRVRIAKKLGLNAIPAREVQLPFRGYRDSSDLLDWER